MRILYMSESTGWSGGAQQVIWMAESLRKRGQNLVLACQPGSDILLKARESGIPTVEIRLRQDYDVPAARKVARILKEQKIEIFHAQHSTAHAVGLMAAWWAKVPVFAVTRRVIFPIKRNVFSRVKYLSKRINGYIAISSAVKDELLKAGISPSRIEVIPSVVHQKIVAPEERLAVRREFGLAAARPVILNVANYADFKGQDILMAAIPRVLKSCPEAQFLFAGRQTEDLAPAAERLGVSGHVRLAGFRTDVPRLLAAADLFVLPSIQEAAGTALREAMAAGLACIGTEVGGIPESIRHDETGLLVPPGDPEALAEAIAHLLKNPPIAKNLAVRGQAYILDHFTLEPASDKMEAFYERLLQRTSS